MIAQGHGWRQRGRGTAVPLCPCLCSRLLPPSIKNFLMIIKCPLITIRMPRCDLFNAIFARQHTLWFFASLNIKKGKFATSIKLPKSLNILALGAGQISSLTPSPDQGLCPWTSLRLFDGKIDAHNNWIKVDIWPTHKRIIALLCLCFCLYVVFLALNS